MYHGKLKANKASIGTPEHVFIPNRWLLHRA